MKTVKQKILQYLQRKREKIENLSKGNFLTGELKDFFHTEIIFTSSDIGGKRLSHKQAQQIVVQYPSFSKINPNDKTLLQAKGQKLALEFIEDYAKKKDLIDIYVIRNLHKIIMQEAWPEIAGQYRQENMEIKKSSAQLPHYSKIPEEMYFLDQYLLETQKNLSKDDILGVCDFFTNVRYKLAWIHPFRDGNGRIARFALNLIARRYGLPYVLTPATKVNSQMWRAIQKADKGYLTDLCNLHLNLVDHSLDIVLRYWRENKVSS